MKGKFLLTVDAVARMVQDKGTVSDIEVMERLGIGPSYVRSLIDIMLRRYPQIDFENNAFFLKRK